MTAIGPPNNSDRAKVFRGINVSLTVGAAALAGATIYMFERATAASEAAGRAARASSLMPDAAAAQECNNIIGDWNNARASSLTRNKPKEGG